MSSDGPFPDSPWTHPATNVLVTVMDVSTFLLAFFVVPYVFRPVLQEALSPTVPTAVEKSNHVVVCGRPGQAERLIEEFEVRDVEYVIVAGSGSDALAPKDEDRPVIHGDPTEAGVLELPGVSAAERPGVVPEYGFGGRALVADGTPRFHDGHEVL